LITDTPHTLVNGLGQGTTSAYALFSPSHLASFEITFRFSFWHGAGLHRSRTTCSSLTSDLSDTRLVGIVHNITYTIIVLATKGTRNLQTNKHSYRPGVCACGPDYRDNGTTVNIPVGMCIFGLASIPCARIGSVMSIMRVCLCLCLPRVPGKCKDVTRTRMIQERKVSADKPWMKWYSDA
jgi:hypothetical protein